MTKGHTDPHDDRVSRRSAVKAMGASLALAFGATGCRRKPPEHIVSRASGPEYEIPGVPLLYASTWTEGTVPYGIIVRAYEGHPVKIEGNPDHPLNRGSSSAAMQAAIMGLYDPDRLRAPRRRDGTALTWGEVDELVVGALRKASSVAVITRSTLGPAERACLRLFQAACPAAQHLVYEPINDRERRAATEKIFGAPGELLPRFAAARVILSIGSDFLGTDGAVLENIRECAERRAASRADRPLRFYMAEGAFTVTGAGADHRIALRPSAAGPFLTAVRAALGGDPAALADFARARGVSEPLLRALASDLRSARGEAIVLAGPELPEAVHAGVALLNAEIDALGTTLAWNPEVPLAANQPGEIASRLGGGVDVLICLGVNPGYGWPGPGFAPILAGAALSIGHGLYADETVGSCAVWLPSAHNLESWGDASPRRGIDSLCQPLMTPLFDVRQEAESLFRWARALAGESAPAALKEPADWRDFVRRAWLARVAPGAEDPAKTWEEHLRRGVVARDAAVEFPAFNRERAESLAGAAADERGPYELVILPHHALHDGRFANVGWLQELPDPVSSLVWDNVAAVSEGTAASLGVREGDLVAVQAGPASVELPILVQRGMADRVLATTFGHGRTRGGAVAAGAGHTVAPLLHRGPSPYLAVQVKVEPTGRRYRVVRTQERQSREGRPILHWASRDAYLRDRASIQRGRAPHRPSGPPIYPPHEYPGHKWGMAIDLDACTGCGACVAACQAENNSPAVGKDACAVNREMQWLRIDRYLEDDAGEERLLFEPMLCQHCDMAPCENVCPVNATTHSNEGLNTQVYNRCVGTRYCSNNCPWKVRRFNFFHYQKLSLRDPSQTLAYNPQVTVRSRGVMEKCTFCVQRINEAKFRAANRGEKLPPDAIQTACQQACPARAIAFGDMNEPRSGVVRQFASDRVFFVLEELMTKPNIAYLARIINPSSQAMEERPS